MALPDFFILSGGVLPVRITIGDFLQFCKLPCAISHRGLVSVDTFGLPAVESGDALGIEDGICVFTPVTEAFSGGKGL